MLLPSRCALENMQSERKARTVATSRDLQGTPRPPLLYGLKRVVKRSGAKVPRPMRRIIAVETFVPRLIISSGVRK